MREGAITFIFILSAVILAIDIYAFRGVKLLTANLSSNLTRQLIYLGYFLFTLGVILFIVYVVINNSSIATTKSYIMPFTAFGIAIFHIVPKIIFVLFLGVEDLGFAAIWGYKKITSEPGEANEIISRTTFLTKIGLTLAAVQMGRIAYGVAKGRYDFKVENSIIEFDNLPEAFDGLKIAHLSDIHIGSFFNNHDAVAKGIEMVNNLNADIIVFTGDLVNNYAWELDGWEEILGKLHAPMGVYSILGNHDYGDYVKWGSEEEKKANLQRLKDTQKQMGFRLLVNESVKLTKHGQSINLLGIENWGKGGFAKYGDLNLALNQSEKNSFKILLSHDPSHWDEQVLEKTDIDLSLAGHTHGMQFGVQIAGLQWSPAKYRYPRWGGLYREKNQYLYVNRGFGYLAFPGRVGMPPELTCLELRKKV